MADSEKSNSGIHSDIPIIVPQGEGKGSDGQPVVYYTDLSLPTDGGISPLIPVAKGVNVVHEVEASMKENRDIDNLKD